MSIIMPAFPRRAPTVSAGRVDNFDPAAKITVSFHDPQPRGQVALVWADGQTLRLKPGGKWERMADNLAVKTK